LSPTVNVFVVVVMVWSDFVLYFTLIYVLLYSLFNWDVATISTTS